MTSIDIFNVVPLLVLQLFKGQVIGPADMKLVWKPQVINEILKSQSK